MSTGKKRPTPRSAAQLDGSGAVAQGSGNALGEGAAQVGRDNSGNMNTGWQFIGQYFASGVSEISAEALADQVDQYLRWLAEDTQHITLRGIERSGGAKVVQLPLETAYVPLRARPQALAGDQAPGRDEKRAGLAKQRRRQARNVDQVEEDGADRDIALDQLLALGNRLVVIGGPGSGKTTVLLHMAWALARSLLDGEPEPARSRLGLHPPVAELPLPLFVPLASFARYRRNLPTHALAEQRTLRHYITHHLISRQAAFRLPADFFERLLDDGRHLLLLLDGLDEVANEAERHSVRQQVESLVQGRDTLRTVVTCRTVAYRQGRTALAATFREVQVQPLDFETHIVPLVQQAYACIHPHDEAQRDKRAANLLAGIQRLEAERHARSIGLEAEPLVGSPLMVRLLLIVHVNQRELPNQRADLFDKAVDALLQVDYGHDEDDISELNAQWETLLDLAQNLAWHLHKQGAEQGREIDEADFRQVLRQDETLAQHADAFIAQARQRGSLVEERNGAYRFIHLALQEFLVARHLREVVAGTQGLPAMVAVLQDKLTDPWWREPILLALGYRAGRAARAVRELITLLCNAHEASAGQLEQALAAAELAGTAAADWPDSGAALRQACAQRLLALLSDADTLLTTSAPLRARAGDALSRLGDRRFDPQRWHLPVGDDLGFVFIPADPGFCIGTRRQDADRVARATGSKAYEDEFNDAVTPSPAVWVARYPVTVAQFRAFVESTGHELGDEDALRDPDSRPVRWVSWREAQQYVIWLQHLLLEAPELADTQAGRLVRSGAWQVGLPSELEWEKAARGGLQGQVFPWGDEADPLRANYDDSGVGTSSVVGCFASNGYGLFDMVGNLWQWTRNPWIETFGQAMLRAEALKPKDDERLVVRGGSWCDHRGLARCASRDRNGPGSRGLGLGFRVVLRSSPVVRSPVRGKR